MTASATIGYTAREVRPLRTVGTGEDRRTVRVQTGRGNSRREAINSSLGLRR